MLLTHSDTEQILQIVNHWALCPRCLAVVHRKCAAEKSCVRLKVSSLVSLVHASDCHS